MSTGFGRVFAIGASSLAVLLGALDTYVVVTIMRDIMQDVGIPINQLQRITWIVTMYLLGYIAAMPLLGRASDRFGRKLLLQVSLATFMVGSVVTGWAGHLGDFHLLIAGRTIQGVASGALLPVTLALGADLWAQRNRAGVLGGIGAAQELGLELVGPEGLRVLGLDQRRGGGHQRRGLRGAAEPRVGWEAADGRIDVLAGGEDQSSTVADMKLLVESIRHGGYRAEYTELRDAGHYAPWEQPVMVGKLLRRFFDSVME